MGTAPRWVMFAFDVGEDGDQFVVEWYARAYEAEEAAHEYAADARTGATVLVLKSGAQA
jgi:hypothetical protein